MEPNPRAIAKNTQKKGDRSRQNKNMRYAEKVFSDSGYSSYP
jgi:hypothetical protein